MNGRDVRLLHTSAWHLGAPIHWGPDKQAAQDWIPMVRGDREAAIGEDGHRTSAASKIVLNIMGMNVSLVARPNAGINPPPSVAREPKSAAFWRSS
jgi:hypothetical protein